MAELNILDILDGIWERFFTIKQFESSSGEKKEKKFKALGSEIKKIANKISLLRSFLSYAEEVDGNAQVRAHLLVLKNALYDVDCLLDEVSLEGEHHHLLNNQRRLIDQVQSVNKRLITAGRFGKESILRIAALGDAKKHERTGPSMNANGSVIGLEKDVEEMVTRLLTANDNKDGLAVIPVVGLCGVGKTTLVRLVYNDVRIAEHFTPMMWICVTEDFDVDRILEELDNILDEGNISVKSRSQKLKENLKEKRYLLVLDDVWEEDRHKWSSLEQQLLECDADKRARILVTTPSQKVAEAVWTAPSHTLTGLDENDSWSLFESYAFPVSHDQRHPDNLAAIGRKIVMKCKGNPSAIQVLGYHLRRTTDLREWQTVQGREIWSMEQGKEVLRRLRRNYYHLPAHLRDCFAYCSMFPKGYTFERKILVQLWMAQGFIHPSSSQSNDLEDYGNRCLDDLLSWSLFQEEERGPYGDVATVKMHDLLHDLVQSVAGNKCSSEDLAAGYNFKSEYHVSFDSISTQAANLSTNVHQQSSTLRTILRPYTSQVDYKLILDKDGSNFKLLRVLDLHGSGIEVVPSRIGDLISLRYIDLSSNPGIRTLEDSISNLFHLQTLKLLNCERLENLPTEMKKMVSLRHFEMNSKARLTRMPPQMGDLQSLRTLPIFVIGAMSGLPELLKLKHLTGELHILNLENAFEIEEGVLADKVDLQELELAWQAKSPRMYTVDIDDATNDKFLLSMLQPHRNLKKLQVTGYLGKEFPEWMIKMDTSLPNVVEISLVDCIDSLYLPSLAKLPSLKTLRLENLSKVEYMGTSERVFFPALQHLSLIRVINMLRYAEQKELIPSFPCLSKLTIDYCPRLADLPLSGTLEQVSLNAFRPELLQSVQRGLTDKKSSENARLISLRINCCEDLEFLQAYSSTALATLQSLSIVNCPRLQSLSGWMQHLTALEILQIQWCPQLNLHENKHDMRGPGTLRSLKLSGLPSLQSIPMGLHSSTALQNLCIQYCNNLKSLRLEPFPLLKKLELCSCPHLSHLSIREQGSADAPALEKLKVENCPELDLFEGSINGGLSGLKWLKLCGAAKLSSLPDSLRQATGLEYLCIEDCIELVGLPEWLDSLKSLKQLYISDCPKLSGLPQAIKSLKSQGKMNIQNCPNLRHL